VRIRLLFAAVSILILPFVLSPIAGDKQTNFAPFATVALAGHTLSGDWCQCGVPGCICDPGEVGGSSRPLPNKGKAVDQTASPNRANSHSGFDFGTGALILALALFMWTRLRA